MSEIWVVECWESHEYTGIVSVWTSKELAEAEKGSMRAYSDERGLNCAYSVSGPFVVDVGG